MANDLIGRVPSVKRLLNPTLEAIHALGGRASIVGIVNRIIELLVLSPDVVNIPHGDGRRTELEYKLGWARTYLKTYGLIANSGRGIWSLTPLGQDTHHVDPDEVMRTVLQRNRKARDQTSDRGANGAANSETSQWVTNESTVSDLKTAITRLEVEKRRIEEQHRALVTTLRYFEGAGRGREEPHHQHTDKLPGIPDAIAEILAREGPLHRSVIYDRLVEMGVHIRGRDPVNNVGAHLSIDDRFKNVGRGMWDLSKPGNETAEPERFGTNREPDGIGDENDQDEEDSIAW